MEKSFIIFRLWPFSRNLRKELSRKEKVYFYDLGIRNSLIGNFNDLDIRPDIGALWENFCILERLKQNYNYNILRNKYFWRATDKKEIDYIEESGGTLKAFEFKWSSKKKAKLPKAFAEGYKEYNPNFEVINPDNFLELVKQG